MGNPSSKSVKGRAKPSQSTVDVSNLPTFADEISVLNDSPEISKHFIKENVIVWHDPNPKSTENELYAHFLRNICDLQIFKKWDEAVEFIQGTQMLCDVITAGTNGELFATKIADKPNVLSIYVFCGNVDIHKNWAEKNEKVVMVEKNFKDVLEHMRKKIGEWQRQNSSLRVDFPAFQSIYGEMDKNEDNNIHSTLSAITNIENRVQSKSDFLSLARAAYQDGDNMDLFEKEYDEYNMENILKWYTKECFLYKVIQNCVKIATVDSIQKCSLTLKDLETAIKDQYREKSSNFSGLLYKGAYLSNQEWTKLEHNMGKDIEIHGFLSTNKNKNVAIDCAKINKEKKGLITIIVPPAPDLEGQGFAEVQEFSDFNKKEEEEEEKEEEVLFNILSRFTVLEMTEEQTEEGSLRHLVLLYGARNMNRFVKLHKPAVPIQISNIRQLKCNICQSESQNCNIFFADLETKARYICHNCLIKSKDEASSPLVCLRVPPEFTTTRPRQGEKNFSIEGKVTQYQEKVQFPFYGYKCTECHSKKMTMCFKCQICQENKKLWCNECFFNKKDNECLEADHIIVTERTPFTFWSEKMFERQQSHNNVDLKQLFKKGKDLFSARDYSRAKDCYQKFLALNGDKSNDNTAAACYDLGFIYRNSGQYEIALKYSLKALKIFQEQNGENYSDIAAVYNSLGITYHKMGQLEKTLECYQKALEMRKAETGDKDLKVAASYSYLGSIYDALGRLEEAMENHMTALEIKKELYGEGHEELAVNYNNIALIYEKLQEFEKAKEYNRKSLEVRR